MISGSENIWSTYHDVPPDLDLPANLTRQKPYDSDRLHVVDFRGPGIDYSWRIARPPAAVYFNEEMDRLLDQTLLLQMVCVDGKRSGFLGWGAAWKDFPERNAWIGIPQSCSPQCRSLVVRKLFFLYNEIEGEPYGGAQGVLEAALDHLPRHWRKHVGPTPALVETQISMIHPRECRKAVIDTGWIKVVPATDENLVLEQWLKPLNPSARKTLRSVHRKTRSANGYFYKSKGEQP